MVKTCIALMQAGANSCASWQTSVATGHHTAQYLLPRRNCMHRPIRSLTECARPQLEVLAQRIIY